MDEIATDDIAENSDGLCEGVELLDEVGDQDENNRHDELMSSQHSELIVEGDAPPTTRVDDGGADVGTSAGCSANGDAPVSSPQPPSVDVKTLMRAHKIRDCCVMIGSFKDAYKYELSRLNKEREKYERQRRRTNKEAAKRSRVDNEDRESKKKRKKEKEARKRAVSPSDTSVDRSPPLTAAAKKKKSLPALTSCAVCDQPIVAASSGLPIGAIYCSKDCIGKQVKIARQCLKSEEHVMLMDVHGMILNESRTPTVSTLEAFLLQYPNFRPVLNTNRMEKPHKSEEQTNKKDESKRVDVRKVIEHQLQLRSKSTQMTVSSKRIKSLSVEIEEELFRVHKSLNLNYRTWCRGFINRIKDETNSFYYRVLSERISVKKLVTMNPDEMVVYIDGDRPTTTAAAAGSSVPTATPAAPTEYEEHEELILEDSPPPSVGSSTNQATAGDPESVRLPRYSSLTTKYTMVKKKPMIKVEGKSAVDDILGNERDTTGQHNSHLYDANCAICQKKTKLDFAAKERAERMEAKFENKKRFTGAEETRRVPRFPNLGSTAADSARANPFGSTPSTLAGRIAAGDHSRRSPLLHRPPPNGGVTMTPHSVDENYGPDDGGGGSFIDDEVDMAGFVSTSSSFADLRRSSGASGRGRSMAASDDTPGDSAKRSDRRWPTTAATAGSESRTSWRDSGGSRAGKDSSDQNDSWVRPGSSGDAAGGPPRITSWTAAERTVQRDENPWHKHSHCVWGGTFHWGRKYQFTCTLTALSNRMAFRLGHEMPLVTRVIGRIDPRNVWEYVRSLRDSWTKQVVVLMIDPPLSTEARENYLSCYDVMRRENRYGVIDCAEHPTIKDGYVFALEPGEPLPKDLYPLEGPGLPESAEQYGNIIVVIIRKVDAQDSSGAPPQPSSATASRTAANECWRRSGSSSRPTSTRRVVDQSPIRLTPPEDRLSPRRHRDSTGTADAAKQSDSAAMLRSSSPDNFARYLAATQEYEASSAMYDDPPRSAVPASSTNQEPPTAAAVGKSAGTPAASTLTDDQRELTSMVSAVLDEEDSALLSSINTLSDVLAAIDRLNKPGLVVLMVGHYINTHFVSEEESEIISRAISMKSESERLRNSQRLAADETVAQSTTPDAGNRLPPPQRTQAADTAVARREKEAGGASGVEEANEQKENEAVPAAAVEEAAKSPVLAGPEHFDIVKLRRPPRAIAADRLAAANTTAPSSRPDSAASSVGDDSTKAQQISFGAEPTDADASGGQPPPPLSSKASVSATTPPPPPPSSPPPPPPPPPSGGDSPAKKALFVPISVPPPAATSHFLFFPPPPIHSAVGPIVPSTHVPPPPLPQVTVNGGGLASGNHPNLRPPQLNSSDMDISVGDTTGNDVAGSNSFTSLLPPPPPPPSLLQKPPPPAPMVNESFADDDVTVPSFSDNSAVPFFSAPTHVTTFFASTSSTSSPKKNKPQNLKAATGANCIPLGQSTPTRPPQAGGRNGVPLSPFNGPLPPFGGRGGRRGTTVGGPPLNVGERGGSGLSNSGGAGAVPMEKILFDAVQRQQQTSSRPLFGVGRKPPLHASSAPSGSLTGANSVPFGSMSYGASPKPLQQRQPPAIHRSPMPSMNGPMFGSRGASGPSRGARGGGSGVPLNDLINALQRQQHVPRGPQLPPPTAMFNHHPNHQHPPNGGGPNGGPRLPWRPPPANRRF